MSGWIVAGCILVALALLSLLRVGAGAEYSEGGVTAWIRVLGMTVSVYPPKEKTRKKEKKPKKQKKPQPEEQKTGGDPAFLKELLVLGCETAGRLRRKVRLDRVYLDVTVASAGDAAAAALGYGRANAAVGMIWPLLEHTFQIGDRRIRTGVSFQQEKTTVYLLAQASMTVGQLLALAVFVLIRFLGALRAHQDRKTQKKEAV